MFSFNLNLFKKAPEEKALQEQGLDCNQINQKLDELYGLTSTQYYNKFKSGYFDYLRHKKSIVKIGSDLYGPGFASVNNRPYLAALFSRVDEDKIKASQKELTEFLNENGVGKNKKSLKFHVLVRMFDLDYEAYNDETATRLVDNTHNLLLLRLEMERIQDPSANTEPALIYRSEQKRLYALNI
ncbi:MAG TPA: hypothetical protein VLJ15_00910 [Gammaproteobacteria bacterium]|nr:hypothetical protein [Gammaproteobacteria bacterium]